MKNKEYGGVAVCLCSLLVAFCYILSEESEYLFHAQELNLFLYTPLFFKQQLVVAGGFLTWLGTYFTQYFYHPWLGNLLLFVWLGLLLWLSKRAFGVSNRWMPLLLLPLALVLITDFDLGYRLYYLKLRGHFFVAVMGLSLAVSLAWLYRRLRIRLTFMAVAAVIAYPIAGFYGLLAILLMGVISWRLPQMTLRQRIIASVFALLLIIFVPLIYYRQVYYQANSDMIWWQALPIYYDVKGFTTLYLPYVFLALFYVLLAACYGISYELKWMRSGWRQLSIQIVIALLVMTGCYQFWYKDTTFHEELQMNACVDRQDWEGVLRIARQHEGEPTRMIVVYKNLAIFKLGRAGNEMYTYRDGGKAPNCDFEIRMMQLGGKSLYLNYGLPNYCYRWCLEDGVELGWRVEHLKFLVRCALLNHEWTVAQKYIDILKETRYYSEWAGHYEPMAQQAKAEVVDNDTEFAPIRRLMRGVNMLGSDQSLIELFLLNIQAYRDTDDPVCAELVLLSAMQLKDIPTFWRAFNQYARLHVGEPMPRHYQECAYLYGNLESNVDISGMPFDENVKREYHEMMQRAQQCKGMSNEQMAEALRPRFGGTFYFNYFFVRGLKTY
ncbi:MAG: hypothetical protein IJ081_00915 [Prevotella sp.]|nr:hypothetical protein [Prevotella sp.]